MSVQLCRGVPHPADGGTLILPDGGYPFSRSRQGDTPFPGPGGGYPFPHPGPQKGVPPVQVRSQDRGRGVPQPVHHSMYLLCAGRHASCVHAGRLSCSKKYDCWLVARNCILKVEVCIYTHFYRPHSEGMGEVMFLQVSVRSHLRGGGVPHLTDRGGGNHIFADWGIPLSFLMGGYPHPRSGQTIQTRIIVTVFVK